MRKLQVTLTMDWPVTYTRRVRYSDTDAQAIVFNGNYLRYFDDAITDLFLAVKLDQAAMQEQGYEVVTARAEIDFKSTAVLGETLNCSVRVAKIGNTSITFDLECCVNERVTAKGVVTYVAVNPRTFRPVKVPESFLTAMQTIHSLPIPR